MTNQKRNFKHLITLFIAMLLFIFGSSAAFAEKVSQLNQDILLQNPRYDEPLVVGEIPLTTFSFTGSPMGKSNLPINAPLVNKNASSLNFKSNKPQFFKSPTFGRTSRVSVDFNGTQGNGISSSPAMSADGRYVAFESGATNLVPGNIDNHLHIFVQDTLTRQIRRISVASDGTQGNRNSWEPSMSVDGRYVAFYSNASNLVPNDTNGSQDYLNDVFVHDTQTGETIRVSVASDGTQANGDSSEPSISADGRFVAFWSSANNLVANDSNDEWDVFVHDTQTAQTSRVSVASDGTQGNAGSYWPAISANGRFVVFYSNASNLVPGDTGDWSDYFVHDIQTGQTSRISVAADGTQGNSQSYGYSDISADGRYIVFPSFASNLVPGDTNGHWDIFVHDTQSGQNNRVSVASDGTQGNEQSSWQTAISADGRFVAFNSDADNLVPGDTNFKEDVFVHDTHRNETSRVSVASDGTQGNDDIYRRQIAISTNGRFLAFTSPASNLVPNDTNDKADVFMHDRKPEPILSINYPDGAPGSYFTVNGTNFTPTDNVTFTINGENLDGTPTDINGAFEIVLSTDNADEGFYSLTVSAGSNAIISFTLDATLPIRPQESDAIEIVVPSGLADKFRNLLPFIAN